MGRAKKTILGENKTYNNIYLHYKLIAINLFRWSNLPNNIESKNIEKALYNHGQVLFFNDDIFGFMCLPCSNSGALNVYNEPITTQVNGTGFTKNIPIDEGVRILNNDLELPTSYQVNYFVEQLTEIDKTMRANIRQQKFPYIIATTKNNELSMRNIIKKIEQGQEAIYTDEEFTDGGKIGVECLQTNAPFLVDKLQTQKYEVEKNLLSYLGINCTLEKKERLLTDEVNSNNSYIAMNLELMYSQRQEAAKKINEKFNLNIKVEKVVSNLQELFLTSLNKNTNTLPGGEKNE